MIARLFRLRPGPLTVDPDSRAMHAELDRREAAFESAMREMRLASLDTPTILDLYLTQVTAVGGGR